MHFLLAFLPLFLLKGQLWALLLFKQILKVTFLFRLSCLGFVKHLEFVAWHFSSILKNSRPVFLDTLPPPRSPASSLGDSSYMCLVPSRHVLSTFFSVFSLRFLLVLKSGYFFLTFLPVHGSLLPCPVSRWTRLQAELEDVGSDPDHRSKANVTIKRIFTWIFLVSQYIEKLCLHYTVVC